MKTDVRNHAAISRKISHNVEKVVDLTREAKRQQVAALDLEPIKFKLIKDRAGRWRRPTASKNSTRASC